MPVLARHTAPSAVHRKLSVVGVLILIGILMLNGMPRAQAEGSRSLYPNAATGSRASLDWTTTGYGGTNFFGGGTLLRRTLLHVYAQQNEFILMGSSAVGIANGATIGNILVYDPGTVTGPRGDETLPGAPNFDCNVQRGATTRGQITSRAMELVGAQDVAGAAPAGGYLPCNYQAPVTGVYSIAVFGPLGQNSAFTDSGPTGDIAMAGAANFDSQQNATVAAWDVTVRANAASTTDLNGRLFTYALAAFTDGNGRPVNFSVYPVTTDGYQYQIDGRGVDPHGWAFFGNQVGFYDTSISPPAPLYHNLVGSTSQLDAILTGSGLGPAGTGTPSAATTLLQLARPQFPIFLNPPDPVVLNGANGLGIPTTPIAPSVTSAGFTGNVAGNTSYVGVGGTFNLDTSAGVYQIIISAGVDFDPTNPNNRVLRGVSLGGPIALTWDGKANNGVNFPAGGPYSVKVELHGGEYHFPLLDSENSTQGGPTFTLLNPPGGICQPWTGGCNGAFYDDRGYRLQDGSAMVGMPGSVLCGLQPPGTAASDPINGFDSTTAQRAYGANPGDNTGTQCTGSFGDTKALDMWAYFPSSNVQTTLNIVSAVADLSVAKTVSSGTPNVGSNVTFNVTLSNAGPDAATNVLVGDLPPAGLTFVLATPSQGSYVSGTGVWTVGTLANGASATLQVVASVSGVGPYTNVVQVSTADQFDPDSTPNNSNPAEDDQASVSLMGQQADLSLSKTVNNPNPAVGSNVTFTVVVQNAGPSDATNVVVSDLLPAGLTFVSATPSQGSYTSGTGVWTVGTLANGGSATLQMVATLTAPGPHTNIAQVSAADLPDPDSTPGNSDPTEDDQAQSTVQTQIADLSLQKTINTSTPIVGQNVTFLVTVSNAGPDAATNVAVRDQLPASLTFVAAAPSQGTYDTTSGVWAVGTLPNAGSATLQLIATVRGAVLFTNIAQVSQSDQYDPDSVPNNNNSGEDDQGSVDAIGPTAIKLASFTATGQENAVVVRWTTSAELNTWGFHLYRSADGKRTSAVRITPEMMIGKGRGQAIVSYSWTDIDVTPGEIYSYWLQETELSGAINEYGPASVRSQPATVMHSIFVPVIIK